MFKILNFAMLATFLGIGLLQAKDNNTSEEMMETTEQYWAISLNQEILNSQIGVESNFPDQAIFWGLSLDSDNLDDTGWQSLIAEASSGVENSTSFITAASQASEGDGAEDTIIRSIPTELLEAILN
ncbi:MAG: hypothetical protein OXC82_07210 [Rhodobacteraceae bacterium]|nr:hypothetical protein [Paracoccaceae bacterium]